MFSVLLVVAKRRKTFYLEITLIPVIFFIFVYYSGRFVGKERSK